jgi:hypothetical protein
MSKAVFFDWDDTLALRLSREGPVQAGRDALANFGDNLIPIEVGGPNYTTDSIISLLADLTNSDHKWFIISCGENDRQFIELQKKAMEKGKRIIPDDHKWLNCVRADEDPRWARVATGEEPRFDGTHRAGLILKEEIKLDSIRNIIHDHLGGNIPEGSLFVDDDDENVNFVCGQIPQIKPIIPGQNEETIIIPAAIRDVEVIGTFFVNEGFGPQRKTILRKDKVDDIRKKLNLVGTMIPGAPKPSAISTGDMGEEYTLNIVELNDQKQLKDSKIIKVRAQDLDSLNTAVGEQLDLEDITIEFYDAVFDWFVPDEIWQLDSLNYDVKITGNAAPSQTPESSAGERTEYKLNIIKLNDGDQNKVITVRAEGILSLLDEIGKSQNLTNTKISLYDADFEEWVTPTDMSDFKLGEEMTDVMITGNPAPAQNPAPDVQNIDVALSAVRDTMHHELPPGWLKALTRDGKVYYVNEGTRSTQWDIPIISAPEQLPEPVSGVEEEQALLQKRIVELGDSVAEKMATKELFERDGTETVFIEAEINAITAELEMLKRQRTIRKGPPSLPSLSQPPDLAPTVTVDVLKINDKLDKLYSTLAYLQEERDDTKSTVNDIADMVKQIIESVTHMDIQKLKEKIGRSKQTFASLTAEGEPVSTIRGEIDDMERQLTKLTELYDERIQQMLISSPRPDQPDQPPPYRQPGQPPAYPQPGVQQPYPQPQVAQAVAPAQAVAQPAVKNIKVLFLDLDHTIFDHVDYDIRIEKEIVNKQGILHAGYSTLEQQIEWGESAKEQITITSTNMPILLHHCSDRNAYPNIKWFIVSSGNNVRPANSRYQMFKNNFNGLNIQFDNDYVKETGEEVKGPDNKKKFIERVLNKLETGDNLDKSQYIIDKVLFADDNDGNLQTVGSSEWRSNGVKIETVKSFGPLADGDPGTVWINSDVHVILLPNKFIIDIATQLGIDPTKDLGKAALGTGQQATKGERQTILDYIRSSRRGGYKKNSKRRTKNSRRRTKNSRRRRTKNSRRRRTKSKK